MTPPELFTRARAEGRLIEEFGSPVQEFVLKRVNSVDARAMIVEGEL